MSVDIIWSDQGSSTNDFTKIRKGVGVRGEGDGGSEGEGAGRADVEVSAEGDVGNEVTKNWEERWWMMWRGLGYWHSSNFQLISFVDEPLYDKRLQSFHLGIVEK